VLLCVLLYLLVKRQGWRSAPWFFSYTAFAILAGLARFFSRNHRAMYFWTYWTTDAAYALLGICVMYEVSRSVFVNLGRSWWWPRLLFTGMIVVSAVLTGLRGSALPPGLKYRAMEFILFGEVFVRFLEVIMFATLMTLVVVLGLQWRQRPFGIAMGFGLYSTIDLLTTTRFSILGIAYYLSWKWALIVSYSCGVLIWLFFFSAPEKTVPPHGSSVLTFEELDAYRKILRRINR